METVGCRIDAEQMEYPHHSQHPECHETGQEEERQDGEQFNQAVPGKDEGKCCLKRRLVRIPAGRGPYPQTVLNQKHAEREYFNGIEQRKELPELLKSLKYHDQNVENDIDRQKNIE